MVELSQNQETWQIKAYAPSWMDVDQLMLIGEGGVVLAQWSMDEEVERIVSWPKSEDTWNLAVITGAHWAVSEIHFADKESED